MPDNNGRIIEQDMRDALKPAELNIARFKPPAAGPDPPTDPPDPNFVPSLPEIQQQIATKSAEERTKAIFNLLVELITQGCQDEISRQQIIQRLSDLETTVANIQAVLTNNGLS